jgi:NADH:ubiquinone oxidoreductase subunit 6 (subunit J)
MSFNNFFLSFLVATIFGGCTLVIGLQNPIHSILVLISVFIGGSLLLFILNVEYFAVLFLIVYVGAIVVLFLFIVMMLDLKLLNVSQKFKDLFSYRHIIIPILTIEIFMLMCIEHADLYWLYRYGSKDFSQLTSLDFPETNLNIDFAKILQETDQLRALGNILFTEHKTGVVLAAILLFLSMVASILLTMETTAKKTIKQQDPNNQALKRSEINSWR